MAPRQPTRKRARLGQFRGAAALTAALAVALAPPSAAAAAAGCGGEVFRDWLDGRIANVYEPRCYRQALDALPEDVRTYSTAQEDIGRALLSRLRNLAATRAGGAATAAETEPAKPKRALAGAGKGAGGETPSPRREAAAPVAAARPDDRPVLLLLGAAAGVAAAVIAALLGFRRYAARGSSAGKQERIQAASSGARR